MSSAAVQQSTPQQYNDRYGYSSAANLSSSPPSSRRTTRPSGGNGSTSNTPQQSQYASPSSSTAMSTPRGPAVSPASQVSPAEPLSSSTYQQFFPDSSSTGPAFALPVRTSSQQAPTSTATTARDNRGYPSSAYQSDSGYEAPSDRERASDNERRQRTQKSPQDPASAGRDQRSRQAPAQSRSATAVGQLPMDASLPRENSAIINHIVVDDPKADLAREQARIAESRPNQEGTSMPPMVDQTVPADPEQKQRSRQEHLKQQTNRKEVKFGDYILGQTLGEGEFGKVKMGWKKDSSVQVAIKLIRKESLQSNANRLPKIYREISILRELQHPNIVRLHEFVETERHMGIILEYASGGELFDYILNHRYLKDPQARRLFAQLVSGVGYLHKKGIVHRDLKLENLLLDRNKNIIITDFGFANTFNPNDELGDVIEERINDKDFVKRERLGETDSEGLRRGDLMQTSCGSPCYAAPELVVSDGLYTGRKVDVWSCGVILYAMLAGYLPFDDDPANPEGDNINLLYKYIVSTPLTFPEYVTPHARDLLRRILVPDPRKRADLFEVARHSWLSEYSHVVGFIGSSTKSDVDIAASAMRQNEEPTLGRSASVREPTTKAPASSGGIAKQPTRIEDGQGNEYATARDAKRRTVQVEYVAPRDNTTRSEASPATAAVSTPNATSSAGKTKARGDATGPVEVTPSARRETSAPRKDIPASSQAMPPPSRPGRTQARAASDMPSYANQGNVSTSRPNTSGTLGSARLPSRGNSYSQPAVATPTNTNAQAQLSQPKPSSGYIISGPMSSEQVAGGSRPASQHNLSQYQQQQQQQDRNHKRSSTLGSIGDRILGRSSSRRVSQQQPDSTSPAPVEKKIRKYPPVSMRNAMPNNNDEGHSRPSTDSGRRPSFGFNRKNSEAPSDTTKRSSRRFSFLPSGFSMNSFTGKTSESRPASKGGLGYGQSPASRGASEGGNISTPIYYEQTQGRTGTASSQQQPPGMYEKALPQTPGQDLSGSSTTRTYSGLPASQSYPNRTTTGQFPSPPPIQRKQYRDDGYGSNTIENAADPVDRFYNSTGDLSKQGQAASSSQPQYTNYYDAVRPQQTQHAGDYEEAPEPARQQQFRPNQRNFNEQYERGSSGSSSATRKVMDFFRRKAKDRE